jgi:hypothetical protein
MEHNRDLRIFLGAFFGTLCVLGLVFGILAVDSESRRVGFGDGKTLIYEITGKNLNLSCIDTEICYNNFIFLESRVKIRASASPMEDCK